MFLPAALVLLVTLGPATGVARGDQDDDRDDRGKCKAVSGTFVSQAVPVPPCTSPVGICTSGQLKGTLAGGTYAFTMNTLNVVPEPEAPFVSFFSGISVVTTRKGQAVRGVDTGAMNVSPPGFFGSGKFSTLLSFIDGGTGFLHIRGTLDFTTGSASGDYQGQLCLD